MLFSFDCELTLPHFSVRCTTIVKEVDFVLLKLIAEKQKRNLSETQSYLMQNVGQSVSNNIIMDAQLCRLLQRTLKTTECGKR